MRIRVLNRAPGTSINPFVGTDLWGALNAQYLQTPANSRKNRVIVVLSDGQIHSIKPNPST